MCSYVEGEALGVITGLLQEHVSEIDPERTEGRVPVDADTHRNARLRRIAEELFGERRYVVQQRRVGRATGRGGAGYQRGRRGAVGVGHRLREESIAVCIALREIASGRERAILHQVLRIAELATPERANIDEYRRTQAKLLNAAAQRNLDFGAAEVIEIAAERVVRHPLPLGHHQGDWRDRGCRGPR